MKRDGRATYKPSAGAAELIAVILAAHPEFDGSVSAAINWALMVAVIEETVTVEEPGQ